MARNKKGQSTPRGARGGGRGARGGRGGGRGNGRSSSGVSFVPQTRDHGLGFTLADEARTTSQHDHSAWANTNLRQKPVMFVSAGPSEPLKTLDYLLEEKSQAKTTQAIEAEEESAAKMAQAIEVDEAVAAEAPADMNETPDEPEAEESDLDLIGPEELELAIQEKAHVHVTADIQVDEDIRVHEDIEVDQTFFFDVKGEQSHRQKYTAPVHIPERPSSRSSSSSDEVILFKGRDAQRNPKPPAPAPVAIDMEQIQTEIRVIQEEIRIAQLPEPFLEAGKSGKKPKRNQRNNQRNNQRPKKKPTVNDEDAIIADYIANMRENGEEDDLLSALMGNRRDLGGTESEAESSSDESEPLAAKEDDKPEVDLGPDVSDDMEDESASELDDETLAKLIAGHELGLDDVNFGDSSSDSESDDEPAAGKKRAELIDDFDLMDWERPSLSRKKKGKGARAQINFNVSDSELERTLQMAWKSDRMKKSERKKAREQQRALGTLGKNVKPEDLRVKYPQGMDMEQVADELRSFLLSSQDTLALPPMDNHARKIIHDLANKFKIKSKSTGKADQRRPILYRTGRTIPFVEATFDQVVTRTTRRYLPRLDAKGKRPKRPGPSRGNAGAASIQDGEIVGGGAPELGVENRGRTMLEKMGWSTGTALGASNNKGILLPVTQAMKRTKAGLG